MSKVQLRISDTFLQAVFRLPDAVTLDSAAVRHPDGGTGPCVLLLTLDMPDAPPDAALADVSYTRQAGLPDPVQVTGYRFFRDDGTEITRSASAGVS